MKLWRCEVLEPGVPVPLYAKTTMSAVEHDLGLPEHMSLMRLCGSIPDGDLARQERLALAAFTFHAKRYYEGSALGPLTQVSEIPPGLESFWTGGDGTTTSMVVLR